ncbi:MAG: 3-hydroxyacyl-ACP dehydratase FabZ family protein [Pirellulaceae bacterium]
MKNFIVDFSEFDEHKIVCGRTEIERLNPHRFELSLLDGILFEDWESGRFVGFHDVRDDEFWVRGHFPNFPLMPGVLICETAAQLCSYFATKAKVFDSRIIALGGLDEIRFRAPVRPGNRLITMLKRERARENVMISGRFQCYVNRELACDGLIKGVGIRAS